MKKFTCKEIMNGMGGCDMEFEGENPLEVASACSKHISESTDELHKPMRDMMANPNHTEEDRKKWMAWFEGEWDKKSDTQ